MRKRVWAWALLFLALLGVLPGGACAAEVPAPESVIAPLMEQYGLNEDNFAMGWYDLVSGESWYYQADTYRVAGSMYKLPLCMVYTDLLAAGERQPEELVGGYQIAQAMKLAIVYSDNDAAQALRGGLSQNLYEYRDLLAQYSGIDTSQLPESYYTENQMSPRFVIGTLRHLYEQREQYAELLEDMKKAQEGYYFKKSEREYPIAHKYGSFEGSLNDCAVVFTPRPFLLVVFLKNVADGETVLSEICAAMTDYALVLEEAAQAEHQERPAWELPAAAPVESAAPAPAETPAPETEPAGETKAPAAGTAFWLLAGLVGVCLLLGAVQALAAWRRHEGGRACLRRLGRGLLLAAVLLAAGAALSAPVKGTEASLAEAPAPETPSPTPTPTPAPTPMPTPSPEPEAMPTASPAAEKTEWILSFAGDCTIGTLHEWQGMQTADNMLYVVGEDYAYPLRNVREVFESDDFTLVNLEGALTEATGAKAKAYRFRADPAYAAVLTEGSVEAVTLANNHSGDYGEEGLADTKAALEARDIGWTDETSPLVVELERGLTLGVVSFNAVEIDLPVGAVEDYLERIRPAYEQCREAACDLVIAYVHWGWEYRTEPENWMVELAHKLAELGCDMVVGSHSHVLQRTEVYEGTPIFYSLGNFCYGGHSNPEDKDSVIVRQQILATPEGFVLGETSFLPCRISSTAADNDFCPTLYEEGGEDYQRVMARLTENP